MKRRAPLLLIGALLSLASQTWAGEVKVSFSNGLVTVIAVDATPRQILAEWARRGQVRVTNLDRLPGGAVTVQLIDVPEAQALETLLRGSAGYVAAPRAELIAAASAFDRIMLMPGAAPAVPAPGTASAPSAGTGFGRGRQSAPPAFFPDDHEELNEARAAAAREAAARSDVYRQAGTGQVAMPGVITQAPLYSPGALDAQATGGSWQAPASQERSGPFGASQRQTAPAGAATPGVFTALPQPVQPTPYSSEGQPQPPVQSATSSSVPGLIVGQPAQPAGTPAPAGRTGGGTGQVSTFQNPYGLPEPVRPPVVNPNANPYGLPTPVKTTPPATTPPTGPIKTPDADGGRG